MSDHRIGEVFATYRLDAELGRGGMSVVYRATEMTLLGRVVALKLMAPHLAADDRFRDRFLYEARVAASIHHPGLIPIHAFDMHGDELYLAMQLVEGQDLHRRLRRQGPMAPDEALDLLRQTGDALDAVHARGVTHRDVKPANLLLQEPRPGRPPHVYVVDFGVARAADDLHLTQAGEMLGTVSYAAPEQVTGGEVGPPADVYALGCVLFEALTGRPPFVRDTEAALAYAHLEADRPRVSSLRPGLPPGVDEVVARAMARDPDQRWPTGAAMSAALADAVRAAPATVARPTPPPVGPEAPAGSARSSLVAPSFAAPSPPSVPSAGAPPPAGAPPSAPSAWPPAAPSPAAWEPAPAAPSTPHPTHPPAPAPPAPSSGAAPSSPSWPPAVAVPATWEPAPPAAPAPATPAYVPAAGVGVDTSPAPSGVGPVLRTSPTPWHRRRSTVVVAIAVGVAACAVVLAVLITLLRDSGELSTGAAEGGTTTRPVSSSATTSSSSTTPTSTTTTALAAATPAPTAAPAPTAVTTTATAPPTTAAPAPAPTEPETTTSTATTLAPLAAAAAMAPTAGSWTSVLGSYPDLAGCQTALAGVRGTAPGATCLAPDSYASFTPGIAVLAAGSFADGAGAVVYCRDIGRTDRSECYAAPVSQDPADRTRREYP